MNIIKKETPNFTKGRKSGGTDWRPDIIVNHITDGHFPGSVNWVTNPRSMVSYHYMVSQAGEIYGLVDIRDTAWANGTTSDGGARDSRKSSLAAVRERRINANLYTVSIGYEGRHTYTRGALSPAQFEAAVRLISHIRSEVLRIWGHEIPLTQDNIVGHSCITPLHRPNCPGYKFPLDRLQMSDDRLQILDDRFQTTEKEDYDLQNPNPPASVRLPSDNLNSDICNLTPDPWAAEAWQWAQRELRMDGTRPRDAMTRQEAAVLLKRLHGVLSVRDCRSL